MRCKSWITLVSVATLLSKEVDEITLCENVFIGSDRCP
jgi:hypothetical protein